MAKIGRRMKKSTKEIPLVSAYFSRAATRDMEPGDAAQNTTPRGLRDALAQGFDRGSVLKELETGQDHFVARV